MDEPQSLRKTLRSLRVREWSERPVCISVRLRTPHRGRGVELCRCPIKAQQSAAILRNNAQRLRDCFENGRKLQVPLVDPAKWDPDK